MLSASCHKENCAVGFRVGAFVLEPPTHTGATLLAGPGALAKNTSPFVLAYPARGCQALAVALRDGL